MSVKTGANGIDKGGILRRLLMIDLLKGMWVTLKYDIALMKTGKPAALYTEQYPKERPAVAERYRGAPRLNINPDNGTTLCIGCDLCALACPEHLIVVTTERDEKTPRT